MSGTSHPLISGIALGKTAPNELPGCNAAAASPETPIQPEELESAAKMRSWKWLGAFGLISALLLATGCGQTKSAKPPQQATGSSSPSPSTAVRYATAKDAAIAPMIAKTGSTYTEDGVGPSP